MTEVVFEVLESDFLMLLAGPIALDDYLRFKKMISEAFMINDGIY
jgi:hypothetical protein